MKGWDQRFGGIERLVGPKAAGCIQRAHACIIGIGGVGSWAAEALARSGIGQLSLIDMDDICITNTNRQILPRRQRLGRGQHRCIIFDQNRVGVGPTRVDSQRCRHPLTPSVARRPKMQPPPRLDPGHL